MGTALPLAGYTAALIAAALASAGIPLWLKRRVGRIEMLLAFSAGVMLGATFFHMLPEAVRRGGGPALTFAAAGLLAMFLIERFALVHICEEPEEGCEIHPTVGPAAFLGLSVHTLIDGLALGAAMDVGMGPFVFLAIVAHKVPNTLALSSLLVAGGYGRRPVLVMSTALALMIPLGATAYLIAGRWLGPLDFTPAAIAFSAGTFLHLSLSDILPDVHRRAGSRLVPTICLIAGVMMMWGIAQVRP